MNRRANFLLIAVFAFLAVLAGKNFLLAKQIDGGKMKVLGWQVKVQETSDHQYIESLRLRAEDMVWERERSILRSQYRQALEQLIAGNPFAYKYWLQRAWYQFPVNASQRKEQSYSFNMAYQLGHWRKHAQQDLIGYCLSFLSALTTQESKRCLELLQWQINKYGELRTRNTNRLSAQEYGLLVDKLGL